MEKRRGRRRERRKRGKEEEGEEKGGAIHAVPVGPLHVELFFDLSPPLLSLLLLLFSFT